MEDRDLHEKIAEAEAEEEKNKQWLEAKRIEIDLENLKWEIKKGFYIAKAALRKEYHKVTKSDEQNYIGFEKFCKDRGLIEPDLNDEILLIRLKGNNQFL